MVAIHGRICEEGRREWWVVIFENGRIVLRPAAVASLIFCAHASVIGHVAISSAKVRDQPLHGSIRKFKKFDDDVATPFIFSSLFSLVRAITTVKNERT